jgi:hypothetical protein
MSDGKCRHKKLTFGSGGFYIICADDALAPMGCGQYWVAMEITSPTAIEDGGKPRAGRTGLSSSSAIDLYYQNDIRVEPPILDRLGMIPDERS